MKPLKIALYLVGGIAMMPFLVLGLLLQGVGGGFIKVADTILAFTYPENL
jgi:hypothetical protein